MMSPERVASQPSEPSASDLRERRWLRAVAGGDREAMGELYADYFPRLFKFLFRFTHDHGTTEELVNDVMLVVWRKSGEFRGDSRPSSWIFGIAYRHGLKAARKRGRQRTTTAAEPATRDPAERVATRDWIGRALASLPAEQRVAVELVFYLGLSYREVARIVGCPVNTVKTRMFHARQKLRRRLGPET